MACTRGNRRSSIVHKLGFQNPLTKQPILDSATRSRELSYANSVHFCSWLRHRLGIYAFAQFTAQEIESSHVISPSYHKKFSKGVSALEEDSRKFNFLFWRDNYS